MRLLTDRNKRVLRCNCYWKILDKKLIFGIDKVYFQSELREVISRRWVILNIKLYKYSKKKDKLRKSCTPRYNP